MASRVYSATRRLGFRLPVLRPGVTWPLVGLAGLVVAIAAVAVVKLPLAAFALGATVVVVGVASLGLVNMERMLALFLLAGAMMLGQGWANLGIPGAVPIPLTEIIFMPLAGVALLVGRTRLHKQILMPLALFALLVFVRVLFDYPVWGIFAIRDTTSAIEAFILLIGYRAVVRDGVPYWISKMHYLAIAMLLWGTLYPFMTALGTVGPTVGLQRPQPLLDPTGVKFSVIAFGLYFLVFGRKFAGPLALGIVAGLLAIYQARTLYIMLPLTILLIGWATRRFGSMLLKLVPAAAIGGLIILLAASSSVQGSEGPVTTDFLSSHLKTLLGEEGPNAATIDAREGFIQKTFEFVGRSPGTVLVGVGLGPDLTFGQWIGKEGQLVRNPHNSYLEVFARTGVVGFLLWMWMLLSCLVPMAKRARSGYGQTERFCAWILAASAVYLGVGAAQPILAFPYGTVPLFFLLGMGAAVARSPRTHRGGSESGDLRRPSENPLLAGATGQRETKHAAQWQSELPWSVKD